MANENNKISVNGYAKLIGVSEGAVRKAIEKKLIVKGYDKLEKKIIIDEANKEYGNAKQNIKPGHGVSKAKVEEILSSQENKQPPAPSAEVEAFVEEMSYEELFTKLIIHDKLEFKTALLYNEILAAAEKKMKLQERRKILVEKEVVDKQFYALGNEIKTNFLNIPSRVISLIRSSPNDVEAINILTNEINQVLEGLSTL